MPVIRLADKKAEKKEIVIDRFLLGFASLKFYEVLLVKANP
jgi:hypothetical protein